MVRALPVVTGIAVSLEVMGLVVVGLTISSMDFCVYLDPTVLRYQFFWNGYPLVNRDALLDNGVVFHTN